MVLGVVAAGCGGARSSGSWDMFDGPGSTSVSASGSTPTDDKSRKGANDFGFGRIPKGYVGNCPVGQFQPPEEPTAELTRTTQEFLEAANTDPADTSAMWRLMDESLRQAYGSFKRFREHVETARLDPTYVHWELTDRVFLGDGSLLAELIEDRCGEGVLDATWEIEIFFPRFEGVAGGAAQLFFLAREDGPKLWFVY